jgi:ribonuclease HI
LVGRRSFPLGYLDLKTGQLTPEPNLDEDYLSAVLAASGTSVVKLLRQHLNPHLHEPSLGQFFPTFPRTQVRAVGGRLIPAGYRLFFAGRCEDGREVGYYAMFTASLAGVFPAESEPPIRAGFGTGMSQAMAEYQALTAALAELVSRVRKLGIAPHSCAVDIWGDGKGLVEQVNTQLSPEEPETREQYTLVRSYLVQLGAYKLRWHPSVYCLLCFGI